jgi:UDP-N-acetyl-D-glucosamine/UDP-N-acetyl-D-galactosamine dehydrogenase
MTHERKIAVIGLGYVGLPVAVAFSKAGSPLIGFDINAKRIEELKSGIDRTNEVERRELERTTINFTTDPRALRAADFFIVTVPTPIDGSNQPDLGALKMASTTVGSALKKGDIVVYESTVYPGATEEECLPLLERASSLTAGRDFTVGYSPERINPGDPKHRFEMIAKVVSAQDEPTLEIVARVYGSVVKAAIHRAPSIRVAEAAKVIENSQRDINIAFMNELSAILRLLDIDTQDVLAAASTKWNFLNFTPGLVGGHCIGVDPFYLTYRAEKAGYRPEVILSGRRINDDVGRRIARECVGRLRQTGRQDLRVALLGLTFKENIPDIRNSRTIDIVRELTNLGVSVEVHDPLASPEEVEQEYGLRLVPIEKLEAADAVILAVAHESYVTGGWPLVLRLLKKGTGIVFDVKACLDRSVTPANIELLRL